jgi:hypothetical protein
VTLNRTRGHIDIFRQEPDGSGVDEYQCCRCLRRWPPASVVQFVPDDDFYTFWLCLACLLALGAPATPPVENGS